LNLGTRRTSKIGTKVTYWWCKTSDISWFEI